MRSLRVCNRQTQRLCLNNGIGRHSPLFNVHTQTRLSTLPFSFNYLRATGKQTPLSRTTSVSLCQHAATITTTAPFQSESSSPNSRNEPDDRPGLDKAVSYVKDQQIKNPWAREGSQTPPVKRQRSASAMTKGKLLTTPSRLLKLVLPVTTEDYNGDRKDVEPLALLLHPQQPLSYLERLIQAEVPPVKNKKGELHPPRVSFLAVESQEETIQPKKPKAVPENEASEDSEDAPKEENRHQSMVVTKHHQASRPREPLEEGGIQDPDNNKASSNEQDTNGTKTGPFVRWSSSTEIGDFIRDASRVKEFLVEIENSPLGRIPVAVPSFNDRTYYLRMRLRKLSKNLKHLAIVKQECDTLAHRGAQRVALGGLGVMVSWWCIVYELTFETDYGWDTMEPITYLVSLSTLMGGYAWFLYHNREISYRSALDFTVNRRQQKLYQARGIDLQVWESLVEEANALRREIKTVAEEYDVDWDERADEEDERVTEVLKHERRQKESND